MLLVVLNLSEAILQDMQVSVLHRRGLRKRQSNIQTYYRNGLVFQVIKLCSKRAPRRRSHHTKSQEQLHTLVDSFRTAFSAAVEATSRRLSFSMYPTSLSAAVSPSGSKKWSICFFSYWSITPRSLGTGSFPQSFFRGTFWGISVPRQALRVHVPIDSEYSG